jgi:hypothetical protein
MVIQLKRLGRLKLSIEFCLINRKRGRFLEQFLFFGASWPHFRVWACGRVGLWAGLWAFSFRRQKHEYPEEEEGVVIFGVHSKFHWPD